MSSAVELVVDLEDPGVHVEVPDDQLGQGQFERVAVVDIVGGDWGRDLCLLEDTFGS
jgi:hypothetical protein